MNDNGDKMYLNHILDEVTDVEEFITGVSRDEFLDNKEKHKAVIRSLEVVGEAVGNLSEELKEEHPDLPWRDIKDMRNKLIHDYFGVDLDLVWRVANNDAPKLKKIVKSILED